MDDNLHIALSWTRSATYKVEFLSFSETIHFIKEFVTCNFVLSFSLVLQYVLINKCRYEVVYGLYN